MAMKYVVVDVAGMDIFTEEYPNKEDAIEAANDEWAHMTRYDQDRRESFYVLEKDDQADEEDEDYLDGNIVFTIKKGGEVAPWYAVVTDSNYDWGDGSFDLEEAKKMAAEWPYAVIDVIVNDVCNNEIEVVDDNKKFRILPEHWRDWGPMIGPDDAIVTVAQIKRLAFDRGENVFEIIENLGLEEVKE
jgi:hypothetical protein